MQEKVAIKKMAPALTKMMKDHHEVFYATPASKAADNSELADFLNQVK